MNSAEKAFVRFGARFARGLLALPTPVVRLLAGRVPEVAKGIHPEALLIGRLSSIPRPGQSTGIESIPESRERMEIEAEVFGAAAPISLTVEDRVIPGPAGAIPARLYVPQEVRISGALLVYYHGGGWITGSLKTHDANCRSLAAGSGVAILSIDYRLAPEHPFPAAADDAVAAYSYVSTNAGEFGASPTMIAVGGDSAGANLAAVVANEARDAGSRAPVFQLLVYPFLDLAMNQDSYKHFDHGFYLTPEHIHVAADAYVPDHDNRTNPRVTPTNAVDLTGVAPAYVATALADPLRDEGREYVEKLRSAGVPVKHEEFPLLHGFMNMRGSAAARDATAKIAEELRRGLSPG